MRNVPLFIAMSLDGRIADADARVDWLQGETPGEDDMVSYQAFIKDVDTVLMGWNTYHQVATELSPDVWPYGELTSYVLTHRTLPPADGIRFVDEDACDLVRRLKREPGKGIWVCGGPNIIQPLLRENLIDAFHISVIPTILGGGARLFGELDQAHTLRLVKTEHYNGIVDLVYERREGQHGA